MTREDLRPPVWVGHVVLYTNRMAESAHFMRTIGMRSIHEGEEVSVFELRGGTHLILLRKDEVTPDDASFDLMVDDLRATHARFSSLGLAPSEIEARPAIDHELFQVREPAGHVITFFSSHVAGRAV
jgi:catechol 2,3-dioxygenase-like lactoylglutathione lyase family enzyme